MVPTGFTNILKWIKDTYGDVEIYVTGNGYADNGELDDEERMEYILVSSTHKTIIFMHSSSSFIERMEL